MNDKELFKMLLENKEKYKVDIDNDYVSFTSKEELERQEQDDDFEPKTYSFEEYGYHLLNEVFQALGIDSDEV